VGEATVLLRKTASILIALLVAVPLAAEPGGDHLVAQEEISRALSRPAATRARDVAAVSCLLDTPFARTTASRLRMKPSDLQAALATLSDDEMHDLAARAELLKSDPIAGQTYFPSMAGLGTALVVLAVVVLVLGALVVYAIAKLA
jgi:hypothetical protein